ncbi:hypothetical protein H6P81_007536 [Aristolochia fimbriata]|uniref:Uncharacterized protein n=1 Tax=Aristolochia fimbriata TaxID=158543 RepID=A0AAV7F3W9_ARIFI|nr:hypothetical protein H6P81_007536 [Aristolochia fimbriata]
MLTTRGRLIQEANKSQSRNPRGPYSLHCWISHFSFCFCLLQRKLGTFWKAWKHIVSVGCLNVVTQIDRFWNEERAHSRATLSISCT